MKSSKKRDSRFTFNPYTPKTNMNKTKYIIRANYYFYQGTFHAPKNGALRDRETNKRLEFDTREDAVKYLTEIPTLTPFGYSDAMGCTENEDGSFSSTGTYHTAHGEYARPVYRIRKIRVKPVIFKKLDESGMIYSFFRDFEDYWTQDDQDAIDSGSTPSKI